MHHMTNTQLSKEHLKKLKSYFRRFWWGENEKHKKVHMIEYNYLTLPLNLGGLNIIRMEHFNKALLA